MGSFLTDTGPGSWFDELEKPAFNPPNWVNTRKVREIRLRRFCLLAAFLPGVDDSLPGDGLRFVPGVVQRRRLQQGQDSAGILRYAIALQLALDADFLRRTGAGLVVRGNLPDVGVHRHHDLHILPRRQSGRNSHAAVHRLGAVRIDSEL